ncbi:hypothetical protein CSN65_004044 [Salmonella enterica subsp. diarizonae]|nr:hypothetical protein [Salmonella enterica subsp. diarizonae]
MPAQDDWVLLYSKYGEYLAGQVQGEYVELNDGTLSWYGLDSLHDTAVKACQQYGKSKAVYIHSANMNPNLPKGSGVQNTIWKCEP